MKTNVINDLKIGDLVTNGKVIGHIERFTFLGTLKLREDIFYYETAKFTKYEKMEDVIYQNLDNPNL